MMTWLWKCNNRAGAKMQQQDGAKVQPPRWCGNDMGMGHKYMELAIKGAVTIFFFVTLPHGHGTNTRGLAATCSLTIEYAATGQGIGPCFVRPRRWHRVRGRQPKGVHPMPYDLHYVHATWINRTKKPHTTYTTYHTTRRDYINAEDHNHAFNHLVKAFPSTWDEGWKLHSLEIRHKP